MSSRAYSQTHPTTSNVPKQTAFTQGVAQNGKAFIDAQRQAASYGPTGQRQALLDTFNQIASTGQGYSSHPGHTAGYTAWQQAQGFQPDGNYDVTYGRHEGGKYAGYDTADQLKSGVEGASYLARRREMEQSQMLRDRSNQGLDQLKQNFDQSASSPMGANIAALAGLGNARNNLGQATPNGDPVHDFHVAFGTNGFGNNTDKYVQNLDQSQTIANVQGQKTGDYMNQLNDWYAKQGQPLVDNLQTADQIDATPVGQYATGVGAKWGIDPNLIAGWFDPARDVTDQGTMRDVASLDQTGLPYSEQQSTLADAQSSMVDRQRQQAEDEALALSNDVLGATSFPGDQLASQVSAPLPMVHDIVTQPSFQTASDNVGQAMAEAKKAPLPRGVPDTEANRTNAIAQAADAEIAKAVEQVMQSTGDQTSADILARILRSLHNI